LDTECVGSAWVACPLISLGQLRKPENFQQIQILRLVELTWCVPLKKESSSERLLKLLGYPNLDTKVCSLLILLNKEARMDNREWTEKVYEKLKASNEERQRLTLYNNIYT
jgi:hypothetical protein